jgi:hypothetical protein
MDEFRTGPGGGGCPGTGNRGFLQATENSIQNHNTPFALPLAENLKLAIVHAGMEGVLSQTACYRLINILGLQEVSGLTHEKSKS